MMHAAWWRFTAILMMASLGALAMSQAPSPEKAVDSSGTASSLGLGQSLFERNCVVCHGIGGTGGRGPNLTRSRLARAPTDEALQALIENGIPPEMPDGTFFTEADVRALVHYVRSLGLVATQPLTGDPARGGELFATRGCLACHIESGRGHGFGPELTQLGERRSATYIRAALVEPQAHLPSDFLWVRARAANGEVIEGIRANEDTFSIQIKERSGDYRSLRKADLAALDKLPGQTPMPSFDKSLTPAQLDDLVAYLATSRDAP